MKEDHISRYENGSNTYLMEIIFPPPFFLPSSAHTNDNKDAVVFGEKEQLFSPTLDINSESFFNAKNISLWKL